MRNSSKILLFLVLLLSLDQGHILGYSLPDTETHLLSEDVRKISSTLNTLLSNYLKMKFEEILQVSEGKAKRDIERMLFDMKNPVKYSQIKSEISLLSEPVIREVKVFEEENLAIAVVEWKYKRTVPKGKDFEVVNVKREMNYLFKKFKNSWKLISYR
ncbi:MAG: hypothetical protein ABDH28_02735 [Brevinematia bacterium]